MSARLPARVWRYTIGGYQVMKKWLSYRERALLGPFEGSYETAIVISDDSDLLEPVRVLRARLGKREGVLRVRTDRGSVSGGKVDLLLEACAWHVEQAQVPNEVQLSTGGVVRRPTAWR